MCQLTLFSTFVSVFYCLLGPFWFQVNKNVQIHEENCDAIWGTNFRCWMIVRKVSVLFLTFVIKNLPFSLAFIYGSNPTDLFSGIFARAHTGFTIWTWKNVSWTVWSLINLHKRNSATGKYFWCLKNAPNRFQPIFIHWRRV